MAKNISLLGADYPDVPAVVLPKTGGGTAKFVDEDDMQDLFIVESKNISGASCSANTVTDVTKDVTNSGYNAIGVVGFCINGGGHYISTVSCYVNSTTSVKCRLMNRDSAAHSFDSIDVSVLYKKQ